MPWRPASACLQRTQADGTGRRPLAGWTWMQRKRIMTKPMGSRVVLFVLAGLACVAGAATVMAEGGPGQGYSQVPRGAYSVVAEVRAKPGKEAELRAVTLPLVALVR